MMMMMVSIDLSAFLSALQCAFNGTSPYDCKSALETVHHHHYHSSVCTLRQCLLCNLLMLNVSNIPFIFSLSHSLWLNQHHTWLLETKRTFLSVFIIKNFRTRNYDYRCFSLPCFLLLFMRWLVRQELSLWNFFGINNDLGMDTWLLWKF